MSSADFSCALATGSGYSMPLSDPPRMARGARASCPRPMILAPILARGLTMRSIGLDLRERSPEMTLKKGWAARRPATRRMVVPLLPAFSTWSGSRSPLGPRPRT